MVLEVGPLGVINSEGRALMNGISGYKRDLGASLVVQWLRIRLPMQGTQVRALVWEGPTCRGATRPVSRNY